VVLVAPFLLDLTPLEAAILGSILGAVSPAVVVPLMIQFMERGMGAKKGIPTLTLAASAIDDVFVIVIFTILLAIEKGQQVNFSGRSAASPCPSPWASSWASFPAIFSTNCSPKWSSPAPGAPSLCWGWPSSSPGSRI
jgi:hypothetical protein